MAGVSSIRVPRVLGFPIVMVPKKALGGEVKWRMAIDYRYVNRLLQDDNYPLPVIHDLYAQLYGRKYFTCLDLNWGFWNVRLSEQCQQYTAFTIPHKGIYCWKVLPFGMKTSPTEFQHAVERALRPLLAAGSVKVYIDDIIIATMEVKEHLLSFAKCSSFSASLNSTSILRRLSSCNSGSLYLGSYISLNKIEPDTSQGARHHGRLSSQGQESVAIVPGSRQAIYATLFPGSLKLRNH